MSYNSNLLVNIFTVLDYLFNRPSKLLFYVLVCFCFGIAPAQAEDNVLVIYSHDAQLPKVKNQQEEIEQGFAETGNEVNVFHEFLDSDRQIKQSDRQEEFVNYINQKYDSSEIDLLMVVDDPSLELIIEQRDRLFKNIPVVFLDVDNLRQKLLDTPWLTGVLENYTVVETALEAARQMWTDTIIVIDDTGSKNNQEQIREIQQISGRPLKVEVVNDLIKKDIKSRLDGYPDNIPILILGRLLEDASGETSVDPTEDAEILHKRIPNPIYTEDETLLGHGVVGGKIFDSSYHIRQAVELAEEILQGAKPDEVGPRLTGKNRWVFDYRQLNEYDIELDLLPEDSELLYIEPPFYVKHRTVVIIIGLSFLSSFLTIILLIEKVRKRALANKILQENEQRYKDLAKAGANVFWELDKKLKYSYISGDIKDLCGFKPSKLLGQYPPDFHRDNSQLDIDWEVFKQTTQARKPLKDFIFSFKDDNGVRIFKINGKPLFNEKQEFQGYRGVKQEITAEQNLYKKIAYQATYDDLTGLLNRREFNEKLKYSVQKVQKYGTESVLCYLDLDRFKIVNDTAGHLVGDRLLSELAKLLQSTIRKEDTLGRLGGDEFGLILEGCTPSEARQVCEQLISSITNYRLKWKNIEFDVGVSIGMVGISKLATDAAELLSRADLACYQAKNLGRGRVYVAQDNDQKLDLEQAQMGHIANVSQAIEENRFYLVKQPIKPIIDDSQQPQYYEILLRLKDRLGNSITPEEFIPVAERYGVVSTLDRWVLTTTLDIYAEHFAVDRSLVAINLSAASINDERFTNFAINSIKQSQISGDCLCFEISETTARSQIIHAQKFIAAMKNLGVKFALDDFGNGISSFSYLKSLPVDYLKIDSSLVKAVVNQEYDRAIVNSINEVAHLMGIKTVAKFVENEQILKRLQKINIDYAQGYVTGKPEAIKFGKISKIGT